MRACLFDSSAHRAKNYVKFMRRDILNAIKINDPHAKLKTVKVRLAVRPCLYLIVIRAITKPAHQILTHDPYST